MALTTLDPDTALIVVDLQKGIVSLPLAHSIDAVVERSRALLDAFRERGLPVVLVNVAGGAPGRTERPRLAESFPPGWTDLIPELDQQPGDILVTKRTLGCLRQHRSRRPAEDAGRDPGRRHRRGDRNRRRIDRSPGL